MNRSKPLISIGMPVYNEESYIGQAIDSLLLQDYDNFELIISDNNSGDATEDICKEYAAKDRRIRYYRNETNIGSVGNFKKVVELATGDYFVWMAGHDLWHPTFLSRCSEVLSQNESIVLCYPQASWINTEGQSLGVIPGSIDTVGLDTISRFNVVLWGVGYCYPIYGLIRLQAIRKTSLGLKMIGSDNLLLAELALLGAFAHVQEPLLYIRQMEDFGKWDKYVEKVFNSSLSDLSALELFWQMIECHVHLIPKHIDSDRSKDAVTLSVVLCLLTKYQWVLGGLLNSTSQDQEVAKEWERRIGQLFSTIQARATTIEKLFEKVQKKPVQSAPKIIIDGVFFQLYKTGISRVWQSLLEEWAKNGFAQHIIVLDRAETAPKIPGIWYRNVPLYDYGNIEADREMLQKVCDEEGAELFISTYYTTPVSTASVFMAYDMVPEVMQWDLRHPMWQEKHHAIAHACAYIAISENTANDLVKFFPEISKPSVTVAYCGVFSKFSQASLHEINSFKAKYGISQPYFILVVGAGGRNKNTELFLKAFSKLYTWQSFEILCVGNINLLETELKNYGDGVVRILQLNDEELRIAYSGAIALVYPSKYEGFGLPVLEAMACGCPVITCPNSSIPEVAGNAVIYVQDEDVDGLANALCEVQKPNIRNSLIAAGLKRSKEFSWSAMAEKTSQALIDATLLSLGLKEINLIIFPDWSKLDNSLEEELTKLLKDIINCPDRDYLTLLIDNSNISDEAADAALSSIVMNLLMEEDLNVEDGPEINLIGKCSERQWEALLLRLNYRIELENENREAIARANAENLPSCKLDFLSQLSRSTINRSVIDLLYQKREQLAQQLLSLPIDRLANAYRGEIGKTCKALINRGMPGQVLNDSEQELAKVILKQHAKGFDDPNAIQYLLAAMLYYRPEQLSLQCEPNSIPQWLLEDYLNFIFSAPSYFQEIGEAEKYCQYIDRCIQDIHHNISDNIKSNLWQEVAKNFTGQTNFIPLYFNSLNLKEIYRKRAEIIEFYVNSFGGETNYEFPERSPDRKKIRLGILALQFGVQTETFATLPIYKHLKRDLFEIILYTLNTTNHRLERYCAGHADTLIKLPSDLQGQVQKIREAELDILFISTNVTAVTHQVTLLALHRLARIQMVDANSPVTTGMRYVDYYISSKLSEPEHNDREQYTETLIKLDSPPQCFDFATEAQLLATTSISRESLGIGADAIVYISGANIYKILPEVEAAWVKIIAEVPNSVLLLYPFNPNWSSSYPVVGFRQRITATFARHHLSEDQLIILDPAPNRADIKERLKLADIYLDTYPYSGMTSLIDPLEVGLPTVVLEGETSRSKKGASLLRSLQVFDLITSNEEAYIKLAIELGTNSELRQQKRNQIEQKMQENPIFLDSRAYSAQMGALFQELFQKYQTDTLEKNFRLRDINLIVFPDWNQSEESIYQEFNTVISTLVARPDKSQITLLVDTTNISEEDADIAVSSMVMNLMMAEDLDVTDGPEICLIGQLSQRQWKTLLTLIHYRIILENENQQAIANLGVCNIPTYP